MKRLRVYLEGIYESISWSYVARHYFGKSRSWLCQRINGLKIRNKEVQFTENEKKILLDALLDLSNNIKTYSSCYRASLKLLQL